MSARWPIAVVLAGVLAVSACGDGSSRGPSADPSIPGSNQFPVPPVDTVDPSGARHCTSWPLVAMREVGVPGAAQRAVAYTYRGPRGAGTEVEHRPLQGQTVDPLSMNWRQLRFFGLSPRPPAGVLRNLWRLQYAGGPDFGRLGFCTHGYDFIDNGQPPETEYDAYACRTRLGRYQAPYPPIVLSARHVRHLSLRMNNGLAVLTTYSCTTAPRLAVTPSRCLQRFIRARATDGRLVALVGRPRCSLAMSVNGHVALRVVLHRPNGSVITRPFHL
jgi:hypothetical protein